MSTIKAKLVAEGVGLPEDACEVMDLDTRNHGQYQFECDPGEGQYFFGWDQMQPKLPAFRLDRPPTAFALALRLDEWERSGVRAGVEDSRAGPPYCCWALAVARAASDPDSHGPLHAMLIARLTHIGQDHAIRRALGWEVEPGTLAELANCGGDEAPVWKFSITDSDGTYREHWFACDSDAVNMVVVDTWIDDVEGITDPVEARAACYAKVTS